MCSCFHRMQRERVELEQNFARELSNLVQRLSAEKDQLEAELKLKMDQEVMLVRWVETSQLALFRCIWRKPQIGFTVKKNQKQNICF